MPAEPLPGLALDALQLGKLGGLGRPDADLAAAHEVQRSARRPARDTACVRSRRETGPLRNSMVRGRSEPIWSAPSPGSGGREPIRGRRLRTGVARVDAQPRGRHLSRRRPRGAAPAGASRRWRRRSPITRARARTCSAASSAPSSTSSRWCTATSTLPSTPRAACTPSTRTSAASCARRRAASPRARATTPISPRRSSGCTRRCGRPRCRSTELSGAAVARREGCLLGGDQAVRGAVRDPGRDGARGLDGIPALLGRHAGVGRHPRLADGARAGATFLLRPPAWWLGPAW